MVGSQPVGPEQHRRIKVDTRVPSAPKYRLLVQLSSSSVTGCVQLCNVMSLGGARRHPGDSQETRFYERPRTDGTGWGGA